MRCAIPTSPIIFANVVTRRLLYTFASQVRLQKSKWPCLLVTLRHFQSSTAALKSQRTHYEVLGVSPKATQEEIKAAYYRKAKQYHPDAAKEAHADSEEFVLLNTAYQTLSDPHKREMYNLGLQMGGSARASWSEGEMEMSYEEYVRMSRNFEAQSRAAQDRDPFTWARSEFSLFRFVDRFMRQMEQEEMQDLYGKPSSQEMRYLKSLKSRLPPVYGLRETWESFLLSENSAMVLKVRVSTTLDGELGQIFHPNKPTGTAGQPLKQDDDVMEYWLEGERVMHAVRTRSPHTENLDIVTLYDDKDRNAVVARVEIPIPSAFNPLARLSRQHFVLDKRGRQLLAGVRNSLFGTRYFWITEEGDEVARAIRAWWNFKHKWRLEVYDREIAHPALYGFLVSYDTLDSRRKINVGKVMEPALEKLTAKLHNVWKKVKAHLEKRAQQAK